MYACFGLIHLPHTESHSSSTESRQSESPHQLSPPRVRLHVNWVNAEDTYIYEDFIIPRWLSWHGVSLCVDSVDVESHLALTQLTRNETLHQLSHRQMLKNLNKSANPRTKSKKFRSLIIWPIPVFDKCKKREQKISCKCTFKEKVLFILKNKISAVQCKRKTFLLIPLSTPVDSRWTISLNRLFRI